jgi:hypothetical protein
LGGETRSYQLSQSLGLTGVDVHFYGKIDDSFEWFPKVHPLVDQNNWLLIDSGRRNELIAGCQRMMEETSWADVAKKTYAVYENLLMEVMCQKDAPV